MSNEEYYSKTMLHFGKNMLLWANITDNPINSNLCGINSNFYKSDKIVFADDEDIRCRFSVEYSDVSFCIVADIYDRDIVFMKDGVEDWSNTISVFIFNTEDEKLTCRKKRITFLKISPIMMEGNIDAYVELIDPTWKETYLLNKSDYSTHITREGDTMCVALSIKWATLGFDYNSQKYSGFNISYTRVVKGENKILKNYNWLSPNSHHNYTFEFGKLVYALQVDM